MLFSFRLATLACGLTIDGFGPISDNAGGIAEMALFNPEVLKDIIELLSPNIKRYIY